MAKSNKKVILASKSSSKAAARSEEFIVDSDNSDVEPKKAIVDRTRNTNEKAALAKASTSKSKKIAKPVPKEVTPASSSSSSDANSESDSDSDSSESPDDDDSDESLPGITSQKSTKVTNGVKRKAQSQSASDNSSSEEVSSNGESDREKKRVKANDKHQKNIQAVQILDNRPAPIPKAAEAITTTPYVPPTGYVPLKADAFHPSNLTASKLEGKQIWHIIAPANVPLKNLTEFTLADIISEKPILLRSGTDYILKESAPDTTLPQLYLSDKSNRYFATPARIEKTFHLRQTIILPNLTNRQASLNTGSAAASDIARTSVVKIRDQPKGLRMRFKPAGFGKGKPGRIGSASDTEDSSDEDETIPKKATLQFPKTLGAHGVTERKSDEQDSVTTKAKKEKKKLKSAGDGSQAIENGAPKAKNPTNVSTDPATGKKKVVGTVAQTPVQKVVAPEVEMSDAPAVAGEESESKEERRKRKEEKRRRKEEKRIKKEKQSSSQMEVDSD